ncbi:MAG: hypothetical protein IH991_24495 [Planctomycetes bacterium]|nr:hypothetical protein [Planctomycetota bacterium]
MQDDKTVHPKFERPFAGAIELCDFDAELTFFHTPMIIMLASEKGVGDYLRIAPASATRLHKDHVLLIYRFRDSSDVGGSFQSWLDQRGFATERPLRFFRTSTENPVEDGFFACLCAVEGDSGVPERLGSGNVPDWQEFSTDSTTIGDVLVDFVNEEVKRIDNHGCMQFLDRLYAQRPMPKLFDTESAFQEFAASVWSANELRFWSRPVQYPK